jgi:hypothetical protein
MTRTTLPTIIFLAEAFPFDLAGGSQQRWASTILTLTYSARVQLLCFQSHQKSRQETDAELSQFAQQLPTQLKQQFLSRLQYECVFEPKIDQPPGERLGEWLISFFTQQPFLVWQYASHSFQEKFEDLLSTHRPKAIHLGHLRLAQFLPTQWLDRNINKKTRPRLIYEALNVEWQLVKTQADYLPKMGRWRWWWQREVGLTKTYEAKVIRCMDHVFAISELDARELRALKNPHQKANSISVLPVSYPPIPGLTLPPLQNIKSKTPQLLFVGNLEWLPNADAIRWFLTEIWPDFAAKYTTATLTIIGKPCSYMTLEPRFAADRVQFLGFVKDLAEILTAETIFILPFRMGGGVRLKALAAAWAGSAIVSTPRGVQGLQLITEKNCLIGENANHFKHQLMRIAYDTKLKQKLGRAAQKYVIQKHGQKPPSDFWRNYWGKSGLVSKIKARVNTV